MITLLILIGILVFGHSCASLNSLDHALVHLQNVHKLDITKVDITRTGESLEDIIQIDGNFAAFQFTDRSLIPTDWEVIEFKLKLSSNEPVFTVQIFNQSEQRPDGTKFHKYAITPDVVIDMSKMHRIIRPDYDVQLHQLNIALYEKFSIGFAVWDISVNHNISISTKQVHLRDELIWFEDFSDPSYGHQVYLVNSSTASSRAYMNFTFDDPDSSKEYVFRLTVSEKTPIDVYLNAFGAKQVTKLARFEFPDQMYKDFVLSKYFYASQLGKFDLSFVFDGHVTNEAGLMVYFLTARVDKKDAYPEIYSPLYSDFDALDGNVGWWYNNPSLLTGDYTIVAKSKSPLYVCDILVNCYQYDRVAIDHFDTKNNNETVYNFTLSEKYKKLLNHSPLIRLISDDPKFVIDRNTPYHRANKIALALIESHFTGLSLKPQYLNYDNRTIFYQIQVPKQTQIPLSIPIDTIDLRAQKIMIQIYQLKSDNEVHLVGAKVNGETRKSSASHFSLSRGVSTENYIQVAPWQMTNQMVKSFEIEFEVQEQQRANHSQLADLEIHIAVYGIDYPFRHLKQSPKFGDENCHKGPTYGDLDCHYDEYVCPEYYFKYDPIAKTCTRTDAPMYK